MIILFTIIDVRNVAKILKIDFSNFSENDLLLGMNEEAIHGTNYSDTNVTNDNPIITAKIALAHLNVYPNYYNVEYGIFKFHEVLKQKLQEEEETDLEIITDDVPEKEC